MLILTDKAVFQLMNLSELRTHVCMVHTFKQVLFGYIALTVGCYIMHFCIFEKYVTRCFYFDFLYLGALSNIFSLN